MQGQTLFQKGNKDNLAKINKIHEKSKDEVRLHNVTGTDLLAIAEMLAKNKSVVYIALNFKEDELPFPDKALNEMFKAIHNNSELAITSIRFCLNDNFGDTGVKVVADFMERDKKLIGVDLTRTNMGNEGVAALARALTINTSLKNLNISWNDFDDQGLAHIIAMCKVNQTLESCCLDKNMTITDAGVKQLAEVMQTREKKIDFHISERHKISDAVVRLLEDACKPSKVPRP